MNNRLLGSDGFVPVLKKGLSVAGGSEAGGIEICYTTTQTGQDAGISTENANRVIAEKFGASASVIGIDTTSVSMKMYAPTHGHGGEFVYLGIWDSSGNNRAISSGIDTQTLNSSTPTTVTASISSVTIATGDCLGYTNGSPKWSTSEVKAKMNDTEESGAGDPYDGSDSGRVVFTQGSSTGSVHEERDMVFCINS